MDKLYSRGGVARVAAQGFDLGARFRIGGGAGDDLVGREAHRLVAARGAGVARDERSDGATTEAGANR